ncbi:MAG: hypothetical protein K1000chlam3_00429 [Chlamydiae bacterium]|nr:hypothetical protein [Chlamydiota bacterium]
MTAGLSLGTTNYSGGGSALDCAACACVIGTIMASVGPILGISCHSSNSGCSAETQIIAALVSIVGIAILTGIARRFCCSENSNKHSYTAIESV